MAVSLDTLPSNSINNIDTNFQRVKTALQDAVSRSGNTPNPMNADFDMNSNDILNAKDIYGERFFLDGAEFSPDVFQGWSPVFGAVEYNGTVVMQLVDYVGGTGTEPTQFINWYIGSSGYVIDIDDAVNFGSAGVTDGDKGDIVVTDTGLDWKISRRFDTVDDLIADTEMGYSASVQTVTAGQRVEADNYSYEVAASDATDEHVETAGGVKLYVIEKAPNPLMFGKLDNASNTQSAFEKWADYVNAVTKYGVIPSGYYTLSTGGISFGSDVTIEGQNCVIDISPAPNGSWAFLVEGSEGTRYALTANASGASATAAAADLVAGNIVAGSWVRLTSNAVFDTMRTNSRIGEMAEIRTANGTTGAITFGTVGSIVRPLADAYLVSDAATISKMNVVKNTHFIGKGKIVSNNNSGVSSHKGISFAITVGCSVTGWSGAQLDDRFLSVRDSVLFSGKAISGDDFKSTGTGYLVSVAGATQDCYFEDLSSHLVRHLFSTNNSNSFPGVPRRILVNGFLSLDSASATGGSTGDAVDTHAASEQIHFANGIIRNAGGHGIIMEGAGGSIVNVKVYGAGARGLALTNWSDRQAIYHIADVEVQDTVGDGIRVSTVAGAGSIKSITGGNVRIKNSAGIAFYIFATVAEPCKTINFGNITVDGWAASSSAVYLDNVKRGSIGPLDIEATASSPAASCLVRARNCEYLDIGMVTATAPAGFTSVGAILIEQNGSGVAKRVTVAGFNMHSPSDVSGTAFRVGNNVNDVTLGSRRRADGFTTVLSWGTGTGHLLATSAAAP